MALDQSANTPHVSGLFADWLVELTGSTYAYHYLALHNMIISLAVCPVYIKAGAGHSVSFISKLSVVLST
mgnify:CR=1 FL=1